MYFTLATALSEPTGVTEALSSGELCSHDVDAGAFVTTVTIIHALICKFC